jgi:hypothetical protein
MDFRALEPREHFQTYDLAEPAFQPVPPHHSLAVLWYNYTDARMR